MDKEESKFENKYFSSPFFFFLKKEQTEQYLLVFFVPALSEALTNMDNILFSIGMQSTGSQDPWQKPRGAIAIQLSVAGLKMIMV